MCIYCTCTPHIHRGIYVQAGYSTLTSSCHVLFTSMQSSSCTRACSLVWHCRCMCLGCHFYGLCIGTQLCIGTISLSNYDVLEAVFATFTQSWNCLQAFSQHAKSQVYQQGSVNAGATMKQQESQQTIRKIATRKAVTANVDSQLASQQQHIHMRRRLT